MHEERTKEQLKAELEETLNQLQEANHIIDAIRDGGVDALVLKKDGKPHVYSIESADYTYRILIEKFGEGALSISKEGLILYCNDYFAKLIGIPANQITGTFFTEYVDSAVEFQRLKAALERSPSKGEIVLNVKGTKLHVYISLTSLEPHVDAIGLVITDLTEKRKHEEALVEYQQSLEQKVNELNRTNSNLEQFIHVISHDIKEPLRKILTYTSQLNDTRSDRFEPVDIKNLNLVNSSAKRLNSLVDDLVNYSFTANGPEISQVVLAEILHEVLTDLELMITDTSAVIEIGPLPSMRASRVQMRQLFANLISNAIKYSQKDQTPHIKISYDLVTLPLIDDREYHKITLTDNGIGMETTHLGKIFTIFQRLHMRDQYSGNGIGLAICKKIMENHNGFIQVDSIVNDGSTFELYFPTDFDIKE